MEKKKNIFLYINNVPLSAVLSVRKLSKVDNIQYRIMLLRDTKQRVKAPNNEADIVIDCDFSRSFSIAKALLPYEGELLAVTCRSESNISRFSKVIPHVPYLRTPTTQSLVWSTDKYEMRKRLNLFDPKHTPRFTWIKNNSKPERTRVIEKVKFPMIIKPASLAASALVSICYHEDELEKTLKSSFRKIKSKYVTDNRNEEPKLIAEEYIEGEMYSVDAYVDSRGSIYYCPMVRVTTGKNIGHDDFYNYLRITPTGLKKESVESARKRVEIGVRALGLRSTTVHAELLHVDGDWKIIEIGPRVGGFRHILHQLSCDIDHGLNDLLIRIPKKPIIPKKCKGYAASMRYFADSEGEIDQINGVKKIKDLTSFHSILVKLKIGERCSFAKNGGNGVFDLTLFHEDRSKLLADIRRVEQMVEVKVKRRGQTKATANKKVAVKKVVAAEKTSKDDDLKKKVVKKKAVKK